MGLIDNFINKMKSEPSALSEDNKNLDSRIEQNSKDIRTASIHPTNKFIVCNEQKIGIDWPKVVLWTDGNGLGYDTSCYKPQKSRKPQMLVAHWDVCLSTSSMVKVTKERGLSVHFGIDNDGTIYQLLDTKDIAWHAKGVNNVSVGVEISNGVLLKYNKHYVSQGLPPRDIIQDDIIHGNQTGPHLDFYPEQVKAFKALVKALNTAHDIHFKVPTDSKGKLLKGVSPEVVNCTFSGVIGHFHVTTNKVDPGVLPIDKIVEELKSESST